MEILNVVYIEKESIVQAVLSFEHNGKKEHTVSRINLDAKDVNAFNELLESLNIKAHCQTSIEEKKKIIDKPELF